MSIEHLVPDVTFLVSSASEITTTYSTTEEEVLSVGSDSVFKTSDSRLDLLSQGEVDPFAPIEYAKEVHRRLEPANRAGMETVRIHLALEIESNI